MASAIGYACRMPSTLRQIAVHVEEPSQGKYQWVLNEIDGGQWTEIGRANKAVTTYKVAMADGLVALEAMVDDLDVGPRFQDDAPAEEGAGEEASVKEPSNGVRPSARQFFGFGPVR